MSKAIPHPTFADYKPMLLRVVSATVFIIVAVVSLSYAALQWRAGGPEIAKLQMNPTLANVSQEWVRGVVSGHSNKAWLQLDLHKLQQDLEANPWVAHARVSRHWPDTISVEIKEHVPYARFSKNHLVAEDGVVFGVASTEEYEFLPLIEAPQSQTRTALDTWRIISSLLAESELKATALSLDERGEWIVMTHLGIALRFGRFEPKEQASRVIDEVIPALASELTDVAYVDLRYRNGFAVGWKPGALQEGNEG